MMRVDSPEEYEHVRATALSPVVVATNSGDVLIPCMSTMLVRYELLVANTWNPNVVSPDKMELLKQSILDNGFCFPIVTVWDQDSRRFIIVDGFHRWTIAGPEWLGFSHVPMVVLGHDMSRRLAATWTFNKARGSHSVELDAELIRALIAQGVDEPDIAVRLGVDLDTIHRYKQVAGIAEVIGATAVWSRAWEMREDDPAPGSERPAL